MFIQSFSQSSILLIIQSLNSFIHTLILSIHYAIQGQPLLIFLAVEGRITKDHIDCIWAAAQAKHCAKQVHDILVPLCKHLDMPSVLHFMSILSRLDPALHTEQTIFLVSHLLKTIWDTHTIMDHALFGLTTAGGGGGGGASTGSRAAQQVTYFLTDGQEF